MVLLCVSSLLALVLFNLALVYLNRYFLKDNTIFVFHYERKQKAKYVDYAIHLQISMSQTAT